MGMLGPVLGVAAQEDNGEQSRLKWGLCPCLLNLPFQLFCITIPYGAFAGLLLTVQLMSHCAL